MKTLIAICLIFLLSNSCNTKTTPVDAYIEFFNALGLDEIPATTTEAYNDLVQIQNLILDVMRDFSQATTWINWINAVSKIGRIFDVAAGDLVYIANNTVLIQQVDVILNKVNEMTRDPSAYWKNVSMNIYNNPTIIGWAAYDCYRLITVEDYSEFGKRFANLVSLVFNGAPIPRPSSLRALSDKYSAIQFFKMGKETKALTESPEDCMLKALNELALKVIKILENPDTIDLKTMFDDLLALYKELVNCRQ